MNERYSIEVSDESVVIYGDLSIEETFDFINFFDTKGFKSIIGGYENSSLFMRRKSIEQAEETIKIKEHIETEKFYETLYEQCKEKIKKLEKHILSLDNLIKEIVTEEKIKQERLKRQNDEIIKSNRLLNLKKNPETNKIIGDFKINNVDPFPIETKINVTVDPSLLGEKNEKND